MHLSEHRSARLCKSWPGFGQICPVHDLEKVLQGRQSAPVQVDDRTPLHTNTCVPVLVCVRCYVVCMYVGRFYETYNLVVNCIVLITSFLLPYH